MAVVITTTRMTSKDAIDTVRAKLTIEMIERAREKGYDVLALDADSDISFLDRIRDVGARIICQIGQGMRVARREAISAAANFFPESEAYIWLEPEKVNMVPYLAAGIKHVAQEGKDFAFFNRTSLCSYPPEQAHAYAIVRLAAQYLLKVDLDFMFGPVVMSKKMLSYFTQYNGLHGDEWDAIHVPKLRAIRDGATYTVIDIDYKHPPSQTEIETGDMDLLLKRIKQALVVVSAMDKEWPRHISV